MHSVWGLGTWRGPGERRFSIRPFLLWRSGCGRGRLVPIGIHCVIFGALGVHGLFAEDPTVVCPVTRSESIAVFNSSVYVDQGPAVAKIHHFFRRERLRVERSIYIKARTLNNSLHELIWENYSGLNVIKY